MAYKPKLTVLPYRKARRTCGFQIYLSFAALSTYFPAMYCIAFNGECVKRHHSIGLPNKKRFRCVIWNRGRMNEYNAFEEGYGDMLDRTRMDRRYHEPREVLPNP